MTKRTLSLILSIILLSLSLVSCQNKKKTREGLDIVTLTLDWTPNTNHAGFYVAQALGYFQEEGIELSIMQPTEGLTDNIVANGSSEFGISYQENVIRARSENIPIVSIAAIIQHNTSGFASLPDSGIKSPKDFEGKRYGSWDSPSEMDILKTIMKAHNADHER
jgi:ABC-type nitrate/sulfonate/bicarbonate transport system substrate-binding protein